MDGTQRSWRDGPHPHDEDPEAHLGEVLPDPWDDLDPERAGGGGGGGAGAVSG